MIWRHSVFARSPDGWPATFASHLLGHFGHFLVESICRFGAIPLLEDKIACILCRTGNLGKIFARQFKAFQSNHVTTISALLRDWPPVTDNRSSRVSFGEVDFAAMYDALRGGGFISSAPPWRALDDESRAGLLADLGTHQKVDFKSFVKS